MSQSLFVRIGVIAVLSLIVTACETRNVAIKPLPEARSSFPVSKPIITPTAAVVGFEKFSVKVKISGIGSEGVGTCGFKLDQSREFSEDFRVASAAAMGDVFSDLEIRGKQSNDKAIPNARPVVTLTPMSSSTTLSPSTDFSSKFDISTKFIMKVIIFQEGNAPIEEQVFGQHKSLKDMGGDKVLSAFLFGGLGGGASCELWQNWIQDSLSAGFRAALDETKKYLIESRDVFESETAA